MKGFMMPQFRQWAFCGMLVGVLGTGSPAWSQTAGKPKAEPSTAQAAVDRAAENGKFAFIVFYKEDTPAVRTMAEVVKAGVQKRDDKAAAIFVQVTNPAERALVDHFEVSRAPMPLTLAVAPNGAVTGVFAKEISDEKIDEAIVTPTMTRCMKSLQENRLVFVCVQTSEKAVVPAAVKEMQADPQFKDRITLVSMQLRDPEEGRFLNQMQINPDKTTATTAVLLAPPGVLIGKFDGTATAAQVAAALHKAGKCCDDPNCKHGHAPARQTNQPATSRRK
jgi:hypothetical protein